MKNNISLTAIVILVMVSFSLSCKKSKNNPSNGNSSQSQTFTPYYIAPSAPGKIVVSSQNLQLHKNDIANIAASLYNSDGSLSANQPAFTWSCSQSSIVSVAGGAITALSVGFAMVTVSDGTHGSENIAVNIVPDTTVIPAGPANIVFNPFIISTKINQQISIPPFTVTDYKGNVVSGVSPSFVIQNLPTATVSGNNINAGGKKGIGQLMAQINGTYLNGYLPLAVSSGNINDTAVGIMYTTGFPGVFYQYNLIANSIQIQVCKCWLSNSGVVSSVFMTSPDKINIDNPQVIGFTSDGHLISKNAGIATVTMYYDNVSVSQYSGVYLDLNGSWGGNKNGKAYSFCLNNLLYYGIYLGSPGSPANFFEVIGHTPITIAGGEINVTGLKMEKSLVDAGPTTWNVGPDVFFINTMPSIGGAGPSYSLLQNTPDNPDILKLVLGSNDTVVLTRGAGICASLDAVLKNSRAWLPNACFNSLESNGSNFWFFRTNLQSIKFNSDYSYSAHMVTNDTNFSSGSDYTVEVEHYYFSSWSAPSDSFFILNYVDSIYEETIAGGVVTEPLTYWGYDSGPDTTYVSSFDSTHINMISNDLTTCTNPIFTIQ